MPSPALSGLSGLSGSVAGGLSGVLTPAAFTQVTTPTEAKALAADGIGWPAGQPLIVDEFGKWILWVQWLKTSNATLYHFPLVSNDSGATWVKPTMTGFNTTDGDIVIKHVAACYENVNHLMHTIITLTQADGGVYYRQHSFTRDGSNNITGCTRVRQMQLEIGVGTSSFEQPTATWVSAASKFLFTWSATNTATAVKQATRATTRVPDGTANDVTNANWAAPLWENSGAGVTSDPLSSSFPVNQKYSILARSANAADAGCGVALLPNGNLAFVVANGGTGGPSGIGAVWFNQAVWSGANSDWRTGLQTALATDSGQSKITDFNVTTTGGDALKNQRPSKLNVASATAVLGSCARWNNGTDEVVAFAVDPTTGTVTLASAYQAGGAHSYAATTDSCWNPTTGRLVVTYIKTSTQNSFFKSYDSALVAKQGETALHATNVDEPYCAQVGSSTVFYDRNTTDAADPDRFYLYKSVGVWS